jgi:ABC-type dipeptide/oligopeptide/nickel transport system permease component
LFVAQRLAFGVVVLIAITFLTFLGLDMARGESFQAAVVYAGESLLAYLANLMRGDLGMTTAGSVTLRPIPVSEVLASVVPKSLGLLAFSLLIAAMAGISLGLLAARRRHGRGSLTFILASIVGVSIPSFFAALLLQLAMIRWAVSRGSPLLPIGGFGWDKHIILPALVLAARPVAQLARMSFISVAEVLDKDYVRTAASKGLVPRNIWSRHVVRNAAIPILTTVGLSLRFSLSSLPVVEYFFSWPGIGFTLLKSISRKDDNLTVALILCLGVLFIGVNLLLDLSYRFLDPRLRETMAQLRQGPRRALMERLQTWPARLQEALRYNALTDWLHQLRAPEEPSPFKQVLENNSGVQQVDQADYEAQRRRAWWREAAGNLPLIMGGILVLGLLVVIFWGPRLTPFNPYATQGLTIVEGEFFVPPFEPGSVHSWGTDVLGRDIQSLLLAGAQQTLILATLAMVARLLVGFVLGALAGWLSGSWLDRTLLGLAEIIAAFPALLLAMIIVLALGIRQGTRPFVIALCFVGWGEIMQFVRSEVMAIRPQLYIEGAAAVGLRTSRIIVSHVLPILLAALISLAALEMGAVLMLLGELGFVGIFIGGGAFAELDIGGLLYHYSDVPEWGSMLSNVRTYARSYPWVAVYPAAAFFVAIVAFNLFGEGLRRMVQTVGIGLNRLVNRYTLIAALVALLAIGWVRGNTGALAYYRQQALSFAGQRALSSAATLTDPVMEGRSLGTSGMDRAADWIAREFQSLGLQPAGQETGYFQQRTRAFTVLEATPQLSLSSAEAELIYREDYAEYQGYYHGLGEANAPIHLIAGGELVRSTGEPGYRAINEVITGDEILMVLSPDYALYGQRTPRSGLLVVAEDDQDLRHRFTVAGRSPRFRNPITDRITGEETPTLQINEATANQLLAGSGTNVQALRREAAALGGEQILHLSTGVDARMTVTGTLYEKVDVRNILAYWPGAAGRAGALDARFDPNLPGGAVQDSRGGVSQMDDELIVVLAQYDNPPPGPEGIWEAANDNASGVAVMLETIQAMKESDYEPYRTMLFVAYSGEGLDGGEEVRPQDVFKFLQAKTGFSTAYKVEAIIELRNLGAGQGDNLMLAASGNQRLASLFERSARYAGVATKRSDQTVDLSIVFEDRERQGGGGQEAPYVGLSWEGAEATSRTATDTYAQLSAERLEEAGRTLALALMVMGREIQY